jgi:hypothetical protein
MLSIPTGDPEEAYSQRKLSTQNDGKKQLKTPIYGRTHILAI